MKIEFCLRRALPTTLLSAAFLLGTACLATNLFAQNTPVLVGQTITTVAGNGLNGATGDGGLATSASLSNEMRAVAADAQGNLWIVDGGNSKIRFVNAQSGIITTAAGGAAAVCTTAVDKAGDGCTASTQTVLNKPRGIFLDKTGAVYIAGYSDSSIHRIDPVTGIMTLVAGYVAYTGTGTCTKPNTCFSGQKGYSGDNGQAVGAALNAPRGVAVDNNGNVWIADSTNNVIRKVNALTGIITTAVGYNPGTGSAAASGYTGDGMQANSSGVLLSNPTDIVFDSSNNAFIVDFGNRVIRRVDAVTNVITTVIGNGAILPTTPVGPYNFGTAYQLATTLPLGGLTKIAIDNQNNLYISDSTYNVIYFYDATTKYIHIVAGYYGFENGTGYLSPTICSGGTAVGDGCNALDATFYGGTSAIGVAVDPANNIYIADPGDERVRKVSTNVLFPASTVGTGITQPLELHYTANDGPSGTGIAFPTGTTDFTVSQSPTCVTNADNTQDCSLSVTFNPTLPGLRSGKLRSTGSLTHTGFGLQGIGNGSFLGLDTGTATLFGSGLATPGQSVLDALGNLYIADTANNRILQINGSTLAQTTVAGTGTAGYGGDGGAALSATLKSPAAVAISAAGNLLIADTGNNVIRHVDLLSGTITTIAGGATTLCATARDTVGDGCPALSATLKAPAGLAVDNTGNIYIADTGNGLIRRFDPRFKYLNLYGGGASTFCAATSDTYGDACPATQAAFLAPSGLQLDSANNLYIADTGNNLVRVISASNFYVTVVAGNGQATYTGDGAAATSAALNAPTAVALDAATDVYIADTGNHAIRVVNASTKFINTLLGTGGTSGNAGGYGQASEIAFNSPGGLAVNGAGGIYISDTGNNRAIFVNTAIADLAFGNSNLGVTTPSQTLSVNNIGNQALSFSQSPAYALSGSSSSYIIGTSASNTCPGAGTLPVAGLCTYSISFDPATSGTLNSNLTLPGNAVNAGTAYAQLTGKGVQLANTNVAIALTSPASGTLSYGQVGTITATVSPAVGSGTPTGNVTFTIDGKLQPSATLVNAQATLNVNLAVGQHTIGASYGGDNTYASSNNTTTITVVTASTTSLLTVSPSAVIQLNTLTFSATISSTTTGIPTGTVNFYSGSTKLGSATLNAKGVAIYTNNTLAVGSYQVTAIYAGDTNYSGSTSNAVSAVVSPIPPDFSSVMTPTSFSVVSGASIQTTITIQPQGNITGTLTLACAGQPLNSQCRFFPTTITFDGTNTAQSTVMTFWTNLSTAGQASNQAPQAFDQRSVLAAGASIALALGLLTLRRRKNGMLRSMLTLALVVFLSLASIGMLSGCSNSVIGAPGVTPAGSYSLELILSSSIGTVHAIPFTVTVLSSSSNDQHSAPLAQRSLAVSALLLK